MAYTILRVTVLIVGNDLSGIFHFNLPRHPFNRKSRQISQLLKQKYISILINNKQLCCR